MSKYTMGNDHTSFNRMIINIKLSMLQTQIRENCQKGRQLYEMYFSGKNCCL